ncbi:2,4-dichlorophenol 6-monooxygenase [Cladobotryum mycophilum]|uniref:2,4-dichlorophenol 6-monooxygenase n=1 Tax=Cladobotryum mycophilum TaxID=491253 RepID=A0ABR0SBR4_9HYPO
MSVQPSYLVQTECLVVGAGPAGGALAAFLGQNGLKGLVISNAAGTTLTPRAHAVNPFALECLRDIDAEHESIKAGTTGDWFKAQRWCRSMVDIEYGRVGYWGGHPDTQRDLAMASPCEYIDLPQTHLEPILLKHANHFGFDIKFMHELIGIDRKSEEEVLCTVKDHLSNSIYQIKTKYLFGADGGRSTVGRSLEFKFKKSPSFGVACNILLNADLEHLMRHRHAQLHWVMNPNQNTAFGTAPLFRMVKPWRQWLLVCFTPNTNEDPFKNLRTDSPELHAFIKEMIGDDSVKVEVLRLDPWVCRETVAEWYSLGSNIHLLGDAAHRHPPAYGLGSNTCIQDAYNLAWKVAYVQRGLAGPGLLESYNDERQPVGATLVREANAGLDAHAAVWDALGMMANSQEQGTRQLEELNEATEAGASRRVKLHNALESVRREGESLGLAMNQWYASQAIYVADEDGPRPTLQGDPIVKVQISTYPGSRLPHAWLDIPTRRQPISTQDIAGHGAFCIITGNGGEAWKEAAVKISEKTGIPIRAYGIGFGLDYHDVHRDWYDRREVNEDGCVLVRPDRYVAWRSMKVVDDCFSKLSHVMSKILDKTF